MLGRNLGGDEGKSLSENSWTFSKEGTALFGSDFLKHGVEYKRLSEATAVAKSLVNEIQGEFMEEGWALTSIIEMRTKDATSRGEEIAIVFTNPQISTLDHQQEWHPRCIRDKWKKDFILAHRSGIWKLPIDEKVLEVNGFSPADSYGLVIRHNQLPNKTFLGKDKGPLYQKGVVVVHGFLKDTNFKIF